jgi:hypothetical protein
MYSTFMEANITPGDWLRLVSARLQQRWPTVEPQRLEDVAFDLFNDPRLRQLPPEQAAVEWLRPVLPD